MNTGDVATAVDPEPAVRFTAPKPTLVPAPAPHGLGPVSGPHTKNVTLPVGLGPPATAVTTAWPVSPAAIVVVASPGVTLS